MSAIEPITAGRAYRTGTGSVLHVVEVVERGVTYYRDHDTSRYFAPHAIFEAAIRRDRPRV